MKRYPFVYRYRDASGDDHEGTTIAPNLDWAHEDVRALIPPGGELLEIGSADEGDEWAL